MKKLLALLLALTLVLSLAACGGSSTPASSAPAEETEETAPEAAPAEDNEDETPVEEEAPEAQETASDVEAETSVEGSGLLTDALIGMEPVSLPIEGSDHTFTIWMAAPGTLSQVEDLANSNETWAELQARTGVKIQFQMGNFFSQMDDFNLMAAAGSLPEVMNGAANLYSGGPDGALEEELFLNLLDYEEYMPNYMALVNSNEKLKREVSTPEGNMVAFYSLYDEDKYGLGDKGYLIRQDWLEDLGLATPKTYDQLHDVLTAFKEDKGANSAMTLPTSGMNDFVMGGFGVGSTFYVEDGTIKFGPMEEGFREYLELMNQWYEEGLIYRDFYSFANEIMFDGTEMIGAGDVALYYNETGAMVAYAEYSNDPNFKVKGLAPVGKTETDPIYMTEFTPTYVDNSRWTITTNCEDPETIIQVADYCYSVEGIELVNWGVKDVTYTVVDGKNQFTDLILNNPDGYAYRDALSLHVIDGVGSVYDPLRGASSYTAEQLSSWDDWTDANLDYSKALPSKEMLNVDEKSQYAALYSDIETFLKEAIIKYIIGDFSFDTYETDMIGKLEAMNIQECIDLYQTAYDRYVG